ncbi:hypothetical protein ACCS54_07210 [Rhizobium johnstonii]|uniref:hypothetical protein n=1 Tax=Rhizobium johnstonii TaxID=3019933 RepID=UPI003F9A22C0
MKLFQPVFDIVERSNAAGGSSVRTQAQPFTRDEARDISGRSGSYREEDERWWAAYGVHVPDEFRRFLRELVTHIANKGSTYARSSDFFDNRFSFLLDKRDVLSKVCLFSPRVLRDWRSRGSELGYLSVASCQDFGAKPSNGMDSCLFFCGDQKQQLLKTAL